MSAGIDNPHNLSQFGVPMQLPRLSICLCLALTAALVSLGAAEQLRLNYEDLAQRLCDLERLALLPPAGERGEEATSYSRLSRYEESTDRYTDWFHNSYGGGIGDGTGVVSIDAAAREVVMADLKGPGVIWRIWSAAPSDNRVRFYIDNAVEPALDIPFSDIFSGKKPPFSFSELVYEAGRGKSCYVPIPFQRSCRIVTNTSGFGRYFHFGYTRFPPGTELPSFRLPFEKSQMAALARVNKILARRGQSPYPAAKNAVDESNRVVVKPNAPATVFDFTGSGAITELRVKLDGGISEDRDLLRKLTLSIYWDGEEKPSVWAPLGDFFGSAPGTNPYRTLPLGVTDDGFYSFWFMPYSSRARICIGNDGAPRCRNDGLREPPSADQAGRAIRPFSRQMASRRFSARTSGPPAHRLDHAADSRRRTLLRRDVARVEPGGRMVGRGGREILRRWRKIPVVVRHRLGRLFRLCLEGSQSVRSGIPRPDV